MKQLFRCEYCNKIGTTEGIQEHEKECSYNYNKKSCFTCKHATWFLLNIQCSKKELKENSYIERCSDYEWDEKDHTNPLSRKNIFGDNGFGSLF